MFQRPGRGFPWLELWSTHLFITTHQLQLKGPVSLIHTFRILSANYMVMLADWLLVKLLSASSDNVQCHLCISSENLFSVSCLTDHLPLLQFLLLHYF